MGPKTLRKWVRQAQVDAGTKPGPSSVELAEIRRLRKEVRELKETNEILKAAASGGFNWSSQHNAIPNRDGRHRRGKKPKTVHSGCCGGMSERSKLAGESAERSRFLAGSHDIAMTIASPSAVNSEASAATPHGSAQAPTSSAKSGRATRVCLINGRSR